MAGPGAGKTVFINQISEGQTVRDQFLVARKSLAETRAGKPYLALTLMDRTGEMEGRAWDRARELDELAGQGAVVLVKARATSYQGRVQLTINGLERIDRDRVRMGDFLPVSGRDPDEMRAELLEIIDRITHQGLRRLLRTLFSGRTLEEFCTAPAAKKMHHACLHGLLEHTLSVTGLARRLADHYPGLDRDLLLAGALVHDIAKIREFSYQSLPFDYTDSGRFLGHLVLGAEMVREAAAGIGSLDSGELDQLVHMVLSHHGRHEFGAPVLPMTPEAILLHHCDDMDAKMNYIDRLRAEREEEGWSDYQRPLERFLYLRPAGENGQGAEEFTPVRSCPARSGQDQARKTGAGKESPESRQQSLFDL